MILLRLRKLEDEDVDLFKRWLYKEHVAKWYHEPLEWISEIENRRSTFDFVNHFIVVCGDESIGFCQFYEYKQGGEDWQGAIKIEGTYSIDYLIGEEEYLHKGFGKQVIELLVERISKIPEAERIIVQPEPDNAASCNTLLSAGFVYDTENKLYRIEI